MGVTVSFMSLSNVSAERLNLARRYRIKEVTNLFADFSNPDDLYTLEC